VLQPGHRRTAAIVLGGPLQELEEDPMKIIVAALIALTVVIGLVAPAGAFDPDNFWQHQERNLP
jgi:hypothetical protein